MTGRPDAVLFDCYGTLLRIAEPRGVTRRYAALAKATAGPSPMTEAVSLEEALLARGTVAEIAGAVGADARAEAASVTALPGALETVSSLIRAGVPVAVVSNLSLEYADPMRRLLPGVPLALSFETGLAKPDPGMYRLALGMIGAEASTTLMIGDSRRCDLEGPLAVGMRATLLTAGGIPGDGTAVDVATALGMNGFD